jgi:hypothetical protein
MIVDRHEDITHPNKISENPTCDRSITFYGYIRGTHLKLGTKMHLVGVGDYSMAELSAMSDPCPLPDKEKKSKVRSNYLFSVDSMVVISRHETVISQHYVFIPLCAPYIVL